MSAIANKIIAAAKKEIGVKEISKNWSPKIKAYLASTGITEPAAWCMAFVYWIGGQLGWINPLDRTAHCLRQWNKTDKKYRTSTPSPGCVFILKSGNKGAGHTGIVVSVKDSQTIITIEGNTNNSGSREGIEVLQRERATKTVNVGYINLPKMIAEKNKISEITGLSLIAAIGMFFF